MDNTAPALLEAAGIWKHFGDFAANADVSMAIHAGERHALLGENGAGKSTLVKMIYGVLQPSAGGFRWQGQPVTIPRPAIAREMGIGMVFQHFSIFEALTVAENIALALPAEPMGQLSARIAEVSSAYGLAIDPDRAVHTLSTGEKQRVEIIRCLLQAPRLLIMDEPTSVLTPQEAEVLFATLEALSAEGCAILYISHKLEEVRRLCTRATILRQGRVVASCDPAVESARALAEKMVGDEIAWVEREGKATPGAVRLAVRALDLPAPSEFAVALKSLSIEVRAGEVLGIAGIAGEGQAELMDVLSGERLCRADAIIFDGTEMGASGPVARRLAGAAFVPEERNGHAAVSEMSLAENAVLTLHGVEDVAPGGWINRTRAAGWVRRVRDAFDVRAASENPVAGSLSGGNLQKFVVGREILRAPGVLIVSQPTWGVDAGAASVIRRALMDLARDGAAVLVISQDLEEIFSICDRIAVMHHGRLSRPHDVAEMTPEKVGLLMGGAHPDATELPNEELA